VDTDGLTDYTSVGDRLDHHAGPFFETRSSLDWFIKRNRRELVEIGAYVAGTNPSADRALKLWPALEAFLQQDLHDLTPNDRSWSQLAELLDGAS